MGLSSSSGNTEPQAEINVTPLIDVLLVLLIVFMIGLPLATRDLPLAMPTGGETPKGPLPEPLVVRLDAAGSLYLQDVRVEKRQLDHLLRSSAAQDPQPAVLVDVDDSASYQRTAELLSSSRNAGFQRIGFASR